MEKIDKKIISELIDDDMSYDDISRFIMTMPIYTIGAYNCGNDVPLNNDNVVLISSNQGDIAYMANANPRATKQDILEQAVMFKYSHTLLCLCEYIDEFGYDEKAKKSLSYVLDSIEAETTEKN